jgi:hypothetical protein
VLDEPRQEVELAGGEGQRLATTGHHAGSEVDDEVAVAQHVDDLGGRAGRSPQHRPHPQLELAQAERLGHVVVGAVLQALDPLVLLPARRDHDHRQVAAHRPEAPAHLQTAHSREHEVEQHEVRRALHEAVDRPVARRDRVDVVARPGQVGRDGLADRRVVLDEQDAHHERKARRPRARGPASGCVR